MKRPAPFDERALLEELERIRDELHQARVQRQAVQDEFRRFVRGFREPADPATATTGNARATLRPPAAKTPEPKPNEPVAPEEPQQRPGPAPSMPEAPASTTAQEITAEQPMDEPPPQATARAPRLQPWTRVLAGGAVILLAGAAVTIWMRNNTPESAPSSDPPQTAQAATPAPELSATPAAGAPASRDSEIVTIRRVWMRVVVDGERVLEREVPAETRVPLSAQDTIVIRTGDAGAVRLSIRGEDQGFLGREGEVLTRSFTVRPDR